MKVTLSQSAWKSGSPRIDSKRRLAISLVSEMAKFRPEISFPSGSAESRPTNLLLARFLVERRSTEPEPAFIHFSRDRPRDRPPPLRHNRETTSNGSTCDRYFRANGSRCNVSIEWWNERA